LASPTK
jgi:hypothetical protein